MRPKWHCYGAAPPFAKAWDADGQRTDYYDTRPAVSAEDIAAAQRRIAAKVPGFKPKIDFREEGK